MSRNKVGLKQAISDIENLKSEFWADVNVPGHNHSFNQELAKAGRVADFFELGELMMRDALERNESCGGHFREEYQTKEGEALRDDGNYTYTSAWQYMHDKQAPILHKEDLNFQNVQPTQRSYK